MKNFYTYLIVALMGGAGYCLIEILYRGRTHYSMFFAGAIVLSSFYYINQKYEMSFWLKCLVGMLIITGVELLFGLIFNIILKEHVWDYSGVPLNFLGQVCVPFSLLWFALSGVAFKVIDTVQETIGGIKNYATNGRPYDDMRIIHKKLFKRIGIIFWNLIFTTLSFL